LAGEIEKVDIADDNVVMYQKSDEDDESSDSSGVDLTLERDPKSFFLFFNNFMYYSLNSPFVRKRLSANFFSSSLPLYLSFPFFK